MSLAVWHWRLDEPAEVVSGLLGLLDDEERGRAARFSVDDARRRFVVGRARLRQLLGRETGTSPDRVSFRYSAAGKPELAAGGPHFNLAHSGELAVCAVSAAPVGIDLERTRSMPNRAALAQRWFHPHESLRIEAAPDPLAEFFRVWTAKEAALKLIGVGVGESLPRVLTPADPAGWATSLPANDQVLGRCWVRPLDVATGFYGAIASAEEAPAPRPLAWQP